LSRRTLLEFAPLLLVIIEGLGLANSPGSAHHAFLGVPSKD
jgi:hypothetical protein